jgi:GrpB-like predicted nucleotidyltransferase (UPF0157 family)
MSEVCVAPPDPSWIAQFQHEAERIRAAFGVQSVEIHHIGSTAINGIYAKPIIDILLLVEDLSVADAGTPAMRALGYEARGEFGIPGRRYFRKDDSNGTRTHHVHSFVRESDEATRHLAFRDYMNAHPSIAQEYGLLKQRLAKEFPSDMEAYMDGKDKFIKHHEALALAECASK